ncbi:MAG: helix-turn-helix domain-containing protein [Lachnospiraceae bacterium]|nr:helix-turn-helix domain-containing protein [Lachnospiraceae bacterium]
MKTNETKQAFVLARAEGLSLRKAAERCGISPATAVKWQGTFEKRISREKQNRLEELAAEYSLTKEARLRALGSLIEKLNQQIESLDFRKIPPEQIIRLYLQSLRNAEKEYVTPCKLDMQDLPAMLDAVGSGELDPEQVRAMASASEIHKTAILQEKVKELAGILDDLKTEMDRMKQGTDN